MATESKDVELRLHARDYSRKTLGEVVKALDDLTKAQGEQLAGAKKGEVSAKSLADSYEKIKQAVEALISQNALTKTFETQARMLEETKQKTDAARAAYTAYAATLEGIDKVTAKQAAKQATLAKAIETAGKEQTRAQNRYDTAAAKLAKYGIAVDQVEAAQKSMANGVAIGNAALERQSIALDTVEADTRAAAAAEQKAAAERKASAAQQVAAERALSQAASEAASRREALLAIVSRSQKVNYEEAQAQRALAQSMRVAADQADANAKGYLTLARSVKSIKGAELAEQLRAISDPIGVANQNLKGLTSNIDALAAKVGQINGPVKDFRATLQALEATQRGSAGIATQISAYQRQIEVLRQARTEYASARTAVAALTTQMRAGGGDAAELGKNLTASQNALRGAAAAMGVQVTKTRELRDALRSAGVDTRNLGEAEQQLIANTTKATAAVGSLSAAYERHGAASEKAAAKQFKFFDSTRQTLSFTQRLRGELIALAASYIGVQAAIGTATSALDAYGETQKIQGQLGAAFGNDAKVIREEWDYLMNAANRIGISFREAAPAYAKFAIAAKSFGFSGQEIRFVFENLATASRVAGLSASDFEGVLKAVEQSLSKGTIQAEELRGQLGDRLPGAFTIMAKSMNVTTGELGKMMEQGEVTSDQLIGFARQLPKEFQATDAAFQTLTASQARFNNALFQFQTAVATSGFADAYTKLLVDLTELMNSADGKAFAKGLSDAFTAVVSVLRYTIDHVDELKTVLSLLTGLLVGRWIFGVGTAVVALGSALTGLIGITRTAFGVMGTGAAALTGFGTAATVTAGGVGILRGAILLLTRTVPLLAALTLGIMAAKYAYDKLTGAKAKSEGGATGSWDEEMGPPRPKPGQTATADPGEGEYGNKRALDKFDKDAEARQKKLDKERKSALKRSAKDELDERQDLIRGEYKIIRDAAANTIKDKEALSAKMLVIDRQEKQALTTDRIRFEAENAKAGETAANKQVALREQVKNALLKIEDDIAKEQAKVDPSAPFEERRKTRVEAIGHAYDKLRKNIAELSTFDKKGAADALAKVDAYQKQLEAVEDVKARTDEVKRLETDLTDQLSIRDTKIKTQNDLYAAGLLTQEQFLSNVADINTATEDAIKAAAKNLQTFADANANVLTSTEQTNIKARTTGAAASTSSNQADLEDKSAKFQVEAIDNLVAKKTAAEQLFATQFSLRMITEDEYAKKVNDNAELYKAKTLEMIASTIAQLEATKALGILNNTISAERIAQIDAQIARLSNLGTVTANNIAVQSQFERTFTQAFGSSIDTGLNGVIDSLTAMAQGTQSVAEGFKGMALSAIGAIGQLIQQIILAIAKQLILNAIVGATGGNGLIGGAAKALGGVQAHGGAIIGRANSGTRRAVDPGWFANAPRFHEGTVVGLKSDEVPAILQTGEQVLSRDDPNNVLNGAGRAGSAKGNRFVLVDDRSKIPEAMESAEGEAVFVKFLKRNSPTIKSIAKG